MCAAGNIKPFGKRISTVAYGGQRKHKKNIMEFKSEHKERNAALCYNLMHTSQLCSEKINSDVLQLRVCLGKNYKVCDTIFHLND